MPENILEFIVTNKISISVLLVLFLMLGLRVIDKIFDRIRRAGQSNNIMVGFLQGCAKAILSVGIILRICSFSPVFSGFTSQILMSSSLLVAVMGFVFQEGLANIVHGFILMIFKPFSLGDRVSVVIDGERITGYIDKMNLRNTIILNVMNSSHVIVPNAKMDLCVIDNNYYDQDTHSSNFLDFEITYETDIEKACRICSEEIEKHPMVKAAREKMNITAPVNVIVRELAADGIYLRASVITKTIEENFTACSDIRKNLVLRFNKEPDVDFAYPHVQVVKKE